jgi:hypothetical protein
MFEAALARIRAATYFDENTQQAKRYRVHPPATKKLRAKIAKWCRAGIPAELEAFMELTCGFVGGGMTVDLTKAKTGPTGVLGVYDYGNGDCLGLDDEGDRCAVWWIGHDPYGVIFVAASLLDYVTRFADIAEHGDHVRDERVMIKPERELAATKLDDIEDTALVFDFRAALPRTHVDLPSIPRGYNTERLGRLLIARPPKPDEARVVHAREVDHLVELAFGLITMEQFDQARSALTRALALDPSSQRALERMAWLDALVAKR